MTDAITVVPANQPSWDDLQLVVGKARCHAALCFCQRFKIAESAWRSVTDEERAHRLRDQTDCGHPASNTTSGLVAYVDREPAGWCSVEPRTASRTSPTAASRGRNAARTRTTTASGP